MSPPLSKAIAALATVVSMTPAAAKAYPVDCAILLCLSGGWPQSATCAHARAVFIQRISPWPIEPPLQIWRCPLQVSSTGRHTEWSEVAVREAAFEYNLQRTPWVRDDAEEIYNSSATLSTYRHNARNDLPPLQTAPILVQERLQADQDISSPVFDFVRSIRVFDVNLIQGESHHDGDCNQRTGVRVGSYGLQGDFAWSRTNDLRDLPAVFDRGGFPSHCPDIRIRAVLVEWRDGDGNYGWERVDY